MKKSNWLLVATLGLMVAACDSSAEQPRQTLTVAPEGNFVLYVSNQSYAIDPVDITILIDGRKAVIGAFPVENQHNWYQFRFALEPGHHQLVAISARGQARLTQDFEVSAARQWAAVNYWFYPASHYQPTPKHFSWLIQGTPIAFD